MNLGVPPALPGGLTRLTKGTFALRAGYKRPRRLRRPRAKVRQLGMYPAEEFMGRSVRGEATLWECQW